MTAWFGWATAAIVLTMDGVYSRIRRPVARETVPRAAVFLDRDGVIVEDTGYLHRPDDIRLIPGALEAIAQVNQRGYPVVLVTNQAGIGRGYYGWDAFERVQRQLEHALALVDGWFDGVWACSWHPHGLITDPANYYRKPSPGMLEDAAVRLRLNLSASWLVGDKPCDMEAALRAGMRCAVHVSTGFGYSTRCEVNRLCRSWGNSGSAVRYCSDLSEAVSSLGAQFPFAEGIHEPRHDLRRS